MIEAILVPACTLRMGSSAGRPDEQPIHEATLPAFHLARTPVTRSQYARYLEATRSAAPPWWEVPGFTEADHPVVGVSWHEAAAFGSWLASETGRPWRLPTEAEWECGARAGLDQAPTAWGDAVPPGEIPEGAIAGPWPVGRGVPNGFGLCDMGTIVHEWCLDWYDPGYYAAAPRHDPRGPAHGTRRVSRGGSWRHRVRWSPPSARSSLPPEFQYADYGMRLAY
jgi:formylglycine-generating enzyme